MAKQMPSFEEFPKKDVNFVENDPNSECKQDSTSCMDSCNPRKDPVEFLNNTAIGIMLIGLILVTVAFLIPRDYVFDSSIPAAEMEQIELRYNKLGERLDIVIALGTMLVGLGGLIIGGIFTWMLIRGDFKICYENQEDTEQLWKKDRTKNYGSDQMEEDNETITDQIH